MPSSVMAEQVFMGEVNASANASPLYPIHEVIRGLVEMNILVCSNSSLQHSGTFVPKTLRLHRPHGKAWKIAFSDPELTYGKYYL